MDHSTYQKLFEKLPQPFTITSTQIRSAYQSLYDKILDSYKNNNFRKLNIILTDTEYTAEILRFKIPPLEDNQKEDTLLIDFVKLLYSIITLYPVKYYAAQISAASFLNSFLNIHKKINNLVLDWKPFYKIMKYFLISPESQEIYGYYINTDNRQSFESGHLSDIHTFFNLSLQISKYFPDEYEIEIDGNKVKTNTTEQLVKKFFTRISPNGKYTPIYLCFFAYLCPPCKNRYKLYINNLLQELRDTSNAQCIDSILMLIERLIVCNIEDNFSFLIPIIFQIISLHIIQQTTIEYPNMNIIDERSYFASYSTSITKKLSRITISLFFSPSTRQTILERFSSLFISFKSLCHPSISDVKTDRIVNFTRTVVFAIQKVIKMTSSEKSDKLFYNLKKENQPTKAEMHQLLSMICEMNILLVRLVNFNIITEPIIIETTIDSEIIDRYFDFAIQCINLTDASDVAYNGWIILTALIFQIEKSDKILSNFESIFQSAASNLFREDIGLILSIFFSAVFTKIPFDRNKTVKGCEKFNFPKLAHQLVSNMMSLFRCLPSLNEKTSQIDSELYSNILLFFVSMIQNCDDEVKQEILPLFTSLATDEEMIPSVYHIEPIVTDYCLYASNELTEAVIKSIKEQLLITKNQHNHSKFRYLSLIYSTCSLSKDKTIEKVKETTDFLIQFTTNENRKIRKHAWRSISYSLSLFQRLHNLHVRPKSDTIKDNPLENHKLEDYEIEWEKVTDTSELSISIFEPLFEKLMTIKDAHEIDDLLKEVGKAIGVVIKSIPELSEGSINNEVSFALTDSLHDLTQLHKKTVPFKDKFLKCALRIINDFKERETTMIRLISICKFLFSSFQYLISSPNNYTMKLLFNFFPSIDHKQSHFNCQFIYNGLNSLLYTRRRQIIVPVTDDIRHLFTLLIELGISNYRGIRKVCSLLLSDVTDIYPLLFEPIVEDLINKAGSIPIDEFIDFLSFYSIIYTLGEKDKLLCNTMLLLSNNLDLKDNLSLIKLKDFVNNICVLQLPFDSPHSNTKEFVELLNEIEENYLNNKKINRTTNLTLNSIIFMCLKHAYDVSDKVLEFIMSSVTHFDAEISITAEASLLAILRRRAKMTKEKVEIKKNPTISSFPNILDQVTIKLPEDGVYFPTETRSTATETATEEANSSDLEEEEEELNEVDIDDDELQAELDALDVDALDNDAVDLGSACSVDVNVSHIKLKDSVIQIFDTFEKVEIEWKIDDETAIFDSLLYSDMSNGYFIFKDHFFRKKYEFFNDEFMIKSIPKIFSSASNGISDDDELDSTVNYIYIWEMYGITVGPYCIEKLREISIKYLSDSTRVEVVSKVLCDMIKGFLRCILYWSVEDRIKFFKSVVLPSLFIVSSNPNTSSYIEDAIFDAVNRLNPLSISPIIKVLFEFSSGEPNSPLYIRSLLTIFSSIFLKSANFFNAIDQIKDKFISPFISKMSEYSTSMASSIVCIAFSLLEIVSFGNQNSPLYSEELELKKEEIIRIFEEIFTITGRVTDDDDNENLKKVVVKTIMTELSFCATISNDVCSICVPFFYKHLHLIFEVLNSLNQQDEDMFIESTIMFINHPIFICNTEFEFEFFTFLVKEMMSLSLPMQLVLLESLNDMIEANICNIQSSDYSKYESLLLSYGRYEKVANLGNEMRLKIAKILGIFEYRKSTINYELSSDCNENDVSDEILKAASIILNAFLFDKVDKRVTKSFNFIDERVNNKRSKERDFFKSVSEIFIHRHSEHVLPNVEDEIFEYRSIVTPDYIC